jgi:hypothetical protein
VTEKYEFIDGEADNFPVQQMCTWAGVSTSGFYHWKSRPWSATAKRRAELRAVILPGLRRSRVMPGSWRSASSVVPGT